MASQKFCVGTQNFKFVCTKMCVYLKYVGTCTQYVNFVGTQLCGYTKFVGAQNLFILKICETKICGYSKNRGYSILLVFILKIFLIFKLWDTIICGNSKFVGNQNL